ncbi:MAG: hypothetical protein EA383_16005 [Spirochaetaceae bacterium]|nr:MAG: hypothetical protein EA383_16005 [Spirochaetaceae bacterium]
MRDIIQVAVRNKLLDQSQESLDQAAASAREPLYTAGKAGIYRTSCRFRDSVLYLVGRTETDRVMLALSKTQFRSAFPGKPQRMQGVWALEIPMTFPNAKKLWDMFPFTRPVTTKSSLPGIGFGDRLGITTAAHIRVAKQYKLFPVLAQQSVRELSALGRSYQQTVADAAFAVFQEGYQDGYGADADHMRSMRDVRDFAKAEPSMMTLDISDFVRGDMDSLDNRSLQEAFRKLPKKEQSRIRRTYSGKSFNLSGTSIRFRPGDAERCAVMYHSGIEFAAKASAYLHKIRGEDCTIEFTVDEIPVDTELVDHFYIASELEARDIPFYSLAFRFPGAMQKGIDYKGDLRAFRSTFEGFAAVAASVSPHRVGIHSGSDKFSLYPWIGKLSRGSYHLKTSGTSWLVAVETIADISPDLYRRIHEKAMEEFPKALARYEIDADINKVPALDKVRDRQLKDLLSNPHWRQLMHISYGGILSDEDIKKDIMQVLHKNEDAYFAAIAKHFRAHIDGLGVETRKAG